MDKTNARLQIIIMQRSSPIQSQGLQSAEYEQFFRAENQQKEVAAVNESGLIALVDKGTNSRGPAKHKTADNNYTGTLLPIQVVSI